MDFTISLQREIPARSNFKSCVPPPLFEKRAISRLTIGTSAIDNGHIIELSDQIIARLNCRREDRSGVPLLHPNARRAGRFTGTLQKTQGRSRETSLRRALFAWPSGSRSIPRRTSGHERRLHRKPAATAGYRHIGRQRLWPALLRPRHDFRRYRHHQLCPGRVLDAGHVCDAVCRCGAGSAVWPFAHRQRFCRHRLRRACHGRCRLVRAEISHRPCQRHPRRGR